MFHLCVTCPVIELKVFHFRVQVNTACFETVSCGVNHVEGGWPKDLNPQDLEQTLRFRKKVEKDESYISSVLHLHAVRDRPPPPPNPPPWTRPTPRTRPTPNPVSV